MCASGVVILGYCTPQCLNEISYHIWQIKTSDLKQRHWTSTDAGLRTHPEVIHPLADPAVLLWDVLLKVLIEAGIHREELGKRRPVVLFSCRTQTFPAGLTLWLVCRFLWFVCTTSVYTNLPPVFVARPAALFCSSCSFRSSSAALRSSSSCCLIRSAWPAAALAWWRMEEVRSLHVFNIVTTSLQLHVTFFLLKAMWYMNFSTGNSTSSHEHLSSDSSSSGQNVSIVGQ